MGNIKKSRTAKVVAGFVGFVTAFTMSFGTAGAATTAELQAQITALLAQIQGLQTQLGTVQAVTPVAATYTFAKNLKMGDTGTDVMNLQKVLNMKVATQVAATGAGSPGLESTHFGPATKAAVIKFQTLNSISPALGFVGSLTRGSLNTSAPVVTTPVVTVPGVTTPVVAATGPVTAVLATDNPASRAVTTAEAGADLAHFTFSGTGTVTGVTLKRIGISADASLLNVYLYDGATRLTDAASVSSGSMITFNDPNGLFKVEGAKTISIKSDMAGVSGESIGVALVGYTALSQTAVTLATPISGNLMTVASATLAGVTFGTITPAANTSLTPAADITVWESTASITTRDVILSRFTIREVGGIAKADLKNLRLLVDGAVVGTVANPDSNGYATFVPASPLTLKTGSHVFKVVADVMGGSSLSFTFSIRNKTDIGLIDSQYNVGFLTGTAIGSLTGFQQTVSTGYITVQKATNSPSSTIVLAGTDVVLARYTATTYGEKVKVDTLLVDFTSNQTAKLRNGRILVDGVQVGSTTTIDPLNTGTSFNTNYTFLPGVTSVIEVRSDIFDNDGTGAFVSGDTIKATLSLGVNNAQGLVSGDASLDVPNANTDGNTLTIGAGTIALAKDQGYGNQSVVVPTTTTLLGSWTLTAGTNEAVNLNTIQVDLAFADEFAAVDLSNVYVMYGAKQSSTKATVSATAGANTWSISESLPINTSMTFKVYGNIATGAVVTTTTPDTVIPSLKVSGTSVSGTAVNTNSDTVLAGQTITAVNGGTLTVTLDANTPVAAQVVAGSTATDGALKIKLTGTNEDQFVKKLTVYADTNLNSLGVASMNLSWSATSNGTYVTVGADQPVSYTVSTYPGYSTWNLSGTGRISVVKNGSVFLKVTPTYVGSGQTAVTGKNPKLFLGDLQAEGTSLLSASSATPNLVNDAGIIVKANSSATYLDSGETDTAADTTAAATTIVTADGKVFLPGDVIFIDEDAGTDFDAATEELMVVLADAGANLTVQRGAFGTTAVAYAVDTKKIYRLSTATMTTNAGIIGNAQTILNTKLGLAIKADAPSGASTGGTGKYVFGLTASAANNAADPATNTVTITSIDITNNKSVASVANLKAYPAEYDNNSTYATTCVGLSTTKWRCTLVTTGSTNQVDENSSRSYTFRGDLGYSGAGSADFSVASLGTSSVSTNSVVWTDGTTSQTWVNQPTTVLQGGSLTTVGASGSRDQTAPTISSIAIASSGTTDDSIDAGDIITITFGEMIDPVSINATLLPDAVAVTGVLATATGGLTGVQADGIITITGITTFDSGASIAAAASFTTNLALNTAGTQLTVTLNTGTARAVTTPALGTGTTGTTVTDINGNAMAAVASPLPTQTGGGTAF